MERDNGASHPFDEAHLVSEGGHHRQRDDVGLWLLVHHVHVVPAAGPSPWARHEYHIFVGCRLLLVARLIVWSLLMIARTAPGVFDAAVAQFFGLSAVLWTGCLALGLHLGVLRRSRLATHQSETLLHYMHVGVWGTSALCLVVMLAANTLGPTGRRQNSWCWVRADASWAMFVFYYLPLVLVFGYSMLIYTLTRRELVGMHRQAAAASISIGSSASLGSPPPSVAAASGALGGLTRRLRAFLLVFGVINAFQLLNRLRPPLAISALVRPPPPRRLRTHPPTRSLKLRARPAEPSRHSPR